MGAGEVRVVIYGVGCFDGATCDGTVSSCVALSYGRARKEGPASMGGRGDAGVRDTLDHVCIQ